MGRAHARWRISRVPPRVAPLRARSQVRLPSSKMAVERAAILRHLLDSATDPFTRAPLHAQQLEPDVELRARIDEWRAELAAPSPAEAPAPA